MNTNIPSPNLDPVALNDRVTAAVRSHRLKLRVMTSVAFLFGFLAVATGIFIVWFYLIMYLPKQRQMLYDAEKAVQQAKSNSESGQTPIQDQVKRIDEFLGVQILFTHVISMGVTITALAVGVLGLGTLILLSVVILNRRATLNQINASLAQISNQLRWLQDNRVTSVGPT
jgi:NADH:ubiquinone oxidoreductase subunit 3 (subunit A)